VSLSGHAGDLRIALEGLQLPMLLEGASEWVTTSAGDSMVVMKPRGIPVDAMDLVPNVLGMGLKDAIYILENRGLRVRIQGNGMVKRQSLQPGTRAPRFHHRHRADMKLLKDILYKVRIEQVVGSTNTAIEHIVFDSRKVTAFSAFVAHEAPRWMGMLHRQGRGTRCIGHHLRGTPCRVEGWV
jgi:hypothetical protein